MAAEGGAGPRWLDYVLATGGDCDQLLSAAAGLGRLVLLYGDGFDPRSLQTVRRLAALDLPTVVVQIPLPQGDGRGATTELARRNREQLLDIANAGMEIVNLDPVLDADRLTVGSRISRNLIESGIVGEEDAVIVDASALPTRIFFPLIGTLLALGRRSGKGELLVMVSECPELDRLISSGGVEDPGTITGFANGFSRDADPERVRVWAPVLGEQAGPQLEALFELLQPQDVYPVLPFPARDPRRADDLVLEHRSLLFERFEVDPNNFLYVSESNPFDTYRALAGLDVRYRSLLSPVGVPEIVVSTHASKTLGIGVCLAAIEREMPVVNAGPSRYGIAEIPEAEWVENASTLSCIWLHGTPFR